MYCLHTGLVSLTTSDIKKLKIICKQHSGKLKSSQISFIQYEKEIAYTLQISNFIPEHATVWIYKPRSTKYNGESALKVSLPQ